LISGSGQVIVMSHRRTIFSSVGGGRELLHDGRYRGANRWDDQLKLKRSPSVKILRKKPASPTRHQTKVNVSAKVPGWNRCPHLNDDVSRGQKVQASLYTRRPLFWPFDRTRLTSSIFSRARQRARTGGSQDARQGNGRDGWMIQSIVIQFDRLVLLHYEPVFVLRYRP
jgi:hypothetical protein